MRTSILAITTAAMLLAGCGNEVLFQADQELPAGRWERTNKPAFSFEVADTLGEHDVFLDVRHTGDYPYSNLYTFVTLTGPDGRTLTDTVECTLADPTGRWYGKGTGFIFSDRFQAHVLYRMHNRFPRSGRYTFTIEQAMRTDTLSGVIDVGVSVERSSSAS
ncbi:MAG TPA: gliding motility lipoprotein GldH [Flavobacteriales bacterium]|nr:gliding motility lipoprotein GldH [Flavobacteriales bacterium]